QIKKREEMGLSSQKLAKLINIDDKLILKWESGKCIPDNLLIKILAIVFNTNTESILNGED
ncbi:MAG: helix-turn-helix domain-containing protein, partial [Bacilli bacterium]|nr:helix-turn-helix domain-containing protein [Bacilli bacterium]